jgi:hypothetical protein
MQWSTNFIYIILKKSVPTSKETHLHYKVQLVNAVYGNCLFWESYETYKNTVWVQCRMLKNVVHTSYQCALELKYLQETS